MFSKRSTATKRSTLIKRVAGGTLSAAALAATLAMTSTPASAAPAPTNAWINQALAVMKAKHIPGSYSGIERNIKRESNGDPAAVNNTDSNARAGTPSEGLLQMIQPTFKAYHVAGTSNDILNPVSNIVAACNYAAHRYGSIDNVNSAY
ncbi:transglycosylase SLT domain-containing protein [Streptomyces vinaceus]|uniref:transglycosylase SLT domain-containing protein n=1 Tax=Streptomyces vinaceus TaxID=1960 RepID=UPI0037F396DB